jgi:hypothetical protein
MSGAAPTDLRQPIPETRTPREIGTTLAFAVDFARKLYFFVKLQTPGRG